MNMQLIRWLPLPCLCALLWFVQNSAAQPPVGPSSAVWKVTEVYCDPPAPAVGQEYTFKVVVYARQAILTRVEIRELPPGDKVLGNSRQERWVGPGTSTFTFRLSCGVPGG